MNRYSATNTGFQKNKLPAQSYLVNYQISYLTNSTKYARIITQIFLDIFGIKGSLYGIREDGTNTENYFDFIQTDYKDLSGDKYIEKAFRYQVKEVFIMDTQANAEPIAKIQEINTTINGVDTLNIDL